jgi:hypothetical protein
MIKCPADSKESRRMAYTLEDLMAELDACGDDARALSEEGKAAFESLKTLLEEGEMSGEAGPFDFEKFLARMKRGSRPAAE